MDVLAFVKRFASDNELCQDPGNMSCEKNSVSTELSSILCAFVQEPFLAFPHVFASKLQGSVPPMPRKLSQPAKQKREDYLQLAKSLLRTTCVTETIKRAVAFLIDLSTRTDHTPLPALPWHENRAKEVSGQLQFCSDDKLDSLAKLLPAMTLRAMIGARS